MQLTIDVNFEESKHPRAHTGTHGGQFVRKGGGAPPGTIVPGFTVAHKASRRDAELADQLPAETPHDEEAVRFIQFSIAQSLHNSPSSYAPVVRQNGKPIAAAYASHDKHSMTISSVGSIVHGGGAAVMRMLIAKAKQLGLQQINLNGSPGAVEFYKTFGFRSSPRNKSWMTLKL